MILIVGGTGQLGGEIVQRLLDRGLSVRALVRPHSNGESLKRAGVRVVFGDLKDRASLTAACDGISTVITTANSAQRGGEDNTETVDWLGNRNLIDAAQMAGIRQFIFVSALGVDINSPVPLFQAKARSEACLRASGMPYTILAPTTFMEVWFPIIIAMPVQAGQPVSLIGEGRRKHSFISIGDVAQFAIASIGHAEALNRTLPLGGPQAVSWRDVIAISEGVIGRSLDVQSLPPGSAIPGLPETLGKMIGQLMTGLEMFDSVVEMPAMAETFGVRQASVEEAVRRMFARAPQR
jgi:NADH dehydrogenase